MTSTKKASQKSVSKSKSYSSSNYSENYQFQKALKHFENSKSVDLVLIGTDFDLKSDDILKSPVLTIGSNISDSIKQEVELKTHPAWIDGVSRSYTTVVGNAAKFDKKFGGIFSQKSSKN